MTALARPSAHEVMATLTTLGERGLLRRLDVALARFLVDTVGEAIAPEVLLSAALLARAEGQGHSCWPLAGWLRADADETDADEADGLALRAALAPLLQRLPTEPAAWREALLGCAAVDDATDPSDRMDRTEDPAPLVLAGPPDRPRLYLRRYWQYEQHLLAQVRARVAAKPPGGSLHDEAQASAWLTRLFGPPAAARDAEQADTIDWQRLACAATLRGALTVITGGPGTGKTYTAARALALLFATHASPQTLRVALAAPTGKAAARLAQSIAQAWGTLGQSLGAEPEAQAALADWGQRIGPARTLHSLLGARPDTRHWRFDARHPLPLDVLVVDEASMVHLELMAALLQALPPHARLILLGDKDQLASVEAGAVLGDLCQGADLGGYTPSTAAALQALTGQALPAAMVGLQAAQVAQADNAVLQQTVMLRRSRRFGGPIGALAAAVNAGDAAQVHRCLRGDDPAVCVLAPEGQLPLIAPGPAEGVSDAAADNSPGPGLQQRLLARVLDGVALPAQPGAPAAPAVLVGGLRAVYQQVRRGPPAPDEGAHAQWVQAVLAGFDGCRVLAALRDGPWGVAGLNQTLEAALAQAGLIHPGSGRNGWYAGRPVLVTRNDPAAGVFNGDVGLALQGPQGGPLRVWFADGDQLRSGGEAAGVWGRSVLASRLAHVETAFAMTVHKSQGSEFAHTLLVLPPRPSPVLSRELLYTGITRARQALTLVLPGAGVLEAALARRTRRASGLVEGLSMAPTVG